MAVRNRCNRHEHRRKHTPSHGSIASLLDRTILLDSNGGTGEAHASFERHRKRRLGPPRPRDERSAYVGTLTWLGHASFMLGSDSGKRIYVDPFLKDNPK